MVGWTRVEAGTEEKWSDYVPIMKVKPTAFTDGEEGGESRGGAGMPSSGCLLTKLWSPER